MRYENQVVLDMSQQASGQDGAASTPHQADAGETKHAGHAAPKPAAKSLKAGKAKG